MKILLFGKNGQVGWELQRSLAPLGDLIALDRHDRTPPCGDLADGPAIAATVERVRPDVIVNAAAYTAVDRAESEPDRCMAINATAVGTLAAAASAGDAWLVHYSTDYVFDGSGSAPWREVDPTGPLNVYGRSKLEGERLIRASGCRHLILRTSWVYAARGQNFLRTMLRLAAERESLAVVGDQRGAPTGADLLADVTAHVLRRALQQPVVSGTYHVAAAGEASWHDYAVYLIEAARIAGAPLRVAPGAIQPVATEAFPTAAQRPANSRLATDRLRQVFGLTLPDWRPGVVRTLTEILDR